MNRILKKIFKQHDIKGVGTFIHVLYMAAPMLGIVMYIINAVTFYTVAREHIINVLPWFSLGVFIIVLVVGVVVMLMIFYVFIYRSYYTFLNRQTYEHNNPIRKDLEMIKKRLGIKDDKTE
jgi:uncharacterized membrane protein